MDEQDTPQNRLRAVLPHLREAAREALSKVKPGAKAELAVVARNPDGSGHVGAGFELEAFLKDLEATLNELADVRRKLDKVLDHIHTMTIERERATILPT